jgi:hypothetical protein
LTVDGVDLQVRDVGDSALPTPVLVVVLNHGSVVPRI